MKTLKLSKPVLIGVGVVSGLVVGGMGISRSEAAMDWLGFEATVQNQQEQLDNHDDRLTNTEADVDKLQTETKVEPSTEKVIVREVITQPAPVSDTIETPEPVKVTVTTYEVVSNGTEFNCKYTYSDGTTNVFRWKWFGTVNTDSGKTLQSTHTSGYCDERAIGQVK